MANGDVDVTEGSGLKVGTYTISEDAVTRHIQRVTINSSTGVEVDMAALVSSIPDPGQVAAGSSQSFVICNDQPPPAAGGYSIYYDSDTTETVTALKASPGVLYKIRATNFATTPRYIRLWNLATGGVTFASTAPTDVIIIPAATSGDCVVVTETFAPYGLFFSVAITVACSSARTGAGNPTANDVAFTAYYA